MTKLSKDQKVEAIGYLTEFMTAQKCPAVTRTRSK